MFFFLIVLPGSLYSYNKFIKREKTKFANLFMAYWIIVAFIFLSDGVYNLLNAHLDNAPANTMNTEIIQKHIGSNRRPSRYFVLKDDDENKYVMKVEDQDFYNASPIGGRLILFVKPGYWGTQWVQSYLRTK